MKEGEEADANDLASEVETDRTKQKIRRDLVKFRRRLQVTEGIAAIKLKKNNKDICISLFFHIYCLYSRKQLAMSWDFIKPTGQITAGSLLGYLW